MFNLDNKLTGQAPAVYTLPHHVCRSFLSGSALLSARPETTFLEDAFAIHPTRINIMHTYNSRSSQTEDEHLRIRKKTAVNRRRGYKP
jgi:hypothetical protein